MRLTTKTLSKSLSPALKAFRPEKLDVDRFASNLRLYFARIDSAETEENLKTHLMDLFKSTYSPMQIVEQHGAVDFVIRTGAKGTNPAVIFEAKRSSNKADMIHRGSINRKALHELVLYFMRERRAGNSDILHLAICSEHEIFIFDAAVFERNFHNNNRFRREFDAWEGGKKTDKTTDFFYRKIAFPFIEASDAELEATYVHLPTYLEALDEGAPGRDIIGLYKLLGPHHLLKKQLANDSNSLNRAFYDELLHLIGLEEGKDGGAHPILTGQSA